VAAASVVAVTVVALVDPHEPGHYPSCPVLAVTGRWCPGCGSMRAVHDLAHGRVLEAADHNVLSVLAIPYLVLAWALWAYSAAGRRPSARLVRLTGRGAAPWVVPALLVVVIGFAVLRNLPWFGLLAP
jgi:hypothetical protein